MEALYRRNAVLEALRGSRRDLHTLWIQQGVSRKEIAPILQAARRRRLTIKEGSKHQISTLAGDRSHQGVVLEAEPYPYASLDDILALAANRGEDAFVLVLDLVHGPNNLGVLLRSAEICGVHGVIMQDRRAPDITPAIVAAAQGATEHLLIAQETNLNRALEQLKARGVWIIGLAIDDDAQAFGSVDFNMPVGIVVGHEGSGLRRQVQANCDIVLQLPMRGHVESFNAAVAGSIVLYDVWRARGFPGSG
jgi:23S rRNA (guanosine2251-2'-O)-methyltransferase